MEERGGTFDKTGFDKADGGTVVSRCHCWLPSRTEGDTYAARTGVLTTGIMPSAKAFEPRALELAKKWHSDAYMLEVRVHVDEEKEASITTRFFTTLAFRYGSKTDETSEYVVIFDSNQEPVDFQTPTGLPAKYYIPTEPSDWRLDSVDAWQIALANGGTELLERPLPQWPSETTSCTVWLIRYERLVWDVICERRNVENRFTFYIDPQSGEILNKWLSQ